MTDIIIIDDQKSFLQRIKDILSLHPDQYEIIKFIKDPAINDKIKGGSLEKYLNKNINYLLKNEPIILLDIQFGRATKKEERLGVEIAKYLLSYHKKWAPKIICLTNHPNQLRFDELFSLGVNRFVEKGKLDFSLMAALHNARRNQAFLGSYVPSITAGDNNIQIKDEVIRMIAKGYSNSAVILADYPSVGPMKNKYRKQHFNELSSTRVSNHRVPNVQEWNDVAFLLSLLKKHDRNLIDYIEKMCDLSITVNIGR